MSNLLNENAISCAVIAVMMQLRGVMVRRMVMMSIKERPDTAGGVPGSDPTAVLRKIEQRALWLATAIVHHANRDPIRPD